MIFRKKRIFLDYASITPVAPEVRTVMSAHFANPSALYEEGRVAKETMKKSRSHIAQMLGARADEIFFTSGGTESNNLALLGVFQAAKMKGIAEPHVITTNIEHPAILEVCHEIEKWGGKVTYLPVSEEGLVKPAQVRDALTPHTVLVSVMYANNEIGTIQPVKEIGRMIKEWRVQHNTTYPYFHSDACQAPLYLDTNVMKLHLDLVTLDGIKLYGPRGMGLLYVRGGVEIRRMMHGGGQESGLRSGTEHVAGIVGLERALEIAEKMREGEVIRLSEIRDYGFAEILKHFPSVLVNGSRKERLPNNINICFSGADSEFIVVALDVEGISASYSSSCRTLAEDSSSYVIDALGGADCSTSSLRLTLGRETKKYHIDALVQALRKIVKV